MTPEDSPHSRLSAREFAAVLLGIPASGSPWLDRMIEEASRRKVQATAMHALMVHNSLIEHGYMAQGKDQGSPWSDADVADYARSQADAMRSVYREP